MIEHAFLLKSNHIFATQSSYKIYNRVTGSRFSPGEATTVFIFFDEKRTPTRDFSVFIFRGIHHQCRCLMLILEQQFTSECSVGDFCTMLSSNSLIFIIYDMIMRFERVFLFGLWRD